MLSNEERAAAGEIFSAHGYVESLRIASPVGDDECVFVLPASALARLAERTLTVELQQALHRKVWLVAESPEWSTEPLS